MTTLLLSIALRIFPSNVTVDHVEKEITDQGTAVYTLAMSDGSHLDGWMGGTCSRDACFRATDAAGAVVFLEM